MEWSMTGKIKQNKKKTLNQNDPTNMPHPASGEKKKKNHRRQEGGGTPRDSFTV